jgi:NADH-quinone oxidoreductase subunit D
MGPQHPSTHGVLRVVLRSTASGRRLRLVIGYLHRGIEKLCEHRDWAQIVLITDRMDYVAAASNNLGYCRNGREADVARGAPPRALHPHDPAELQRIASHCLWLGTHAMDMGAMTVFLYAFRERELVLDLFEEYCGAR